MSTSPRHAPLPDALADEQEAGSGLAVVTGASTGIGRAIAEELAGRGYELALIADEEAVVGAADEIGRTGTVTHALRADLATEAGIQAAYDGLTELEQTPDVVVLNAGVGANGRFDRIPLEDDLRVVDLNVRATVHLGKLVLRDMAAAGRGRLLITSSIAAVAPGPYQATYAASKAFVQSFAHAVRAEMRGTGVTVTSLMPGPTHTAFFARAAMEDTRIGALRRKDDPAPVARAAVDGLLAGRASVVPGSLLNRIGAGIGAHLPDRLTAWALRPVARPRR